MISRFSFLISFSACLLSSLVSGLAFAQDNTPDPAPEPALTQTFDDPDLAWGPCPPFMPEGCGIAILHGDPTRENLDVFFKVPAGSKLPSHWHTSAERMILVSGELEVTYEGQQAAVLKPGTYAYGPAKRSHHGQCVSDDACVLFIAFESPLDAVPTE